MKANLNGLFRFSDFNCHIFRSDRAKESNQIKSRLLAKNNIHVIDQVINSVIAKRLGKVEQEKDN